MKKKIFILFTFLFLIPIHIFAASTSFASLVYKLYDNLFDSITTLLISTVFLFFAIYIIRYMSLEGEEKSKSKSVLGWGIMAIFIIFSIYGLVSLISGTLFG